MAETTRLSATDVMPVRSRVSWGAIAAGAMVALAIYFVLTLLGIAVGLEVAVRRDVSLGAVAALYSIFALLVSMFFGGWAVSRLAVGESKLEAVLYGIILWGVLFVGMFWLIGMGVRVGFGAMMGMASGAVTVVAEDEQPASSANVVNTLTQRYNSELGGQKFVDDLKKLGVDEDHAKRVQEMVKQRVDSVRDASVPVTEQARRLATDPEVQHAAQLAIDRTRQATWYSLIGVIVSMATVILGSLVGSGDLPVPVAILGVRRTTIGPQA
jgi:hypothetical protein